MAKVQLRHWEVHSQIWSCDSANDYDMDTNLLHNDAVACGIDTADQFRKAVLGS